MKKLLLIPILLIALSGCATETPPVDEIDCDEYPNHVDCIIEDPVDTEDPSPEPDGASHLEIFYINDLHGAILETEDELGLAKIANLLDETRAQNDSEVLFIGGGDLLQGAALSNYYNGLSVIELLNEMGMDAMTVGNHEFDWGLDVVLEYRDGDLENGESDFPFLGANIFYEGTDTIPEGIEPYTIIDKGDFRVGIIGTIGDTLEYSIATKMVEDYEFRDSVELIGDYSEYLRTEENCNYIISMAHESGNINAELTRLEGVQAVDLILNGHSHQAYTTTIGGVPQLQSGSNGEMVGYIDVTLSNSMIDSTLSNLDDGNEPLLQSSSSVIEALINAYVEETDPIFNTPIIESSDGYSTSELSNWLVDLIRQKTDSDIAFHNYGGTRSSIEDGQMLTVSVLYDIWPFDNIIKTTYLKGSVINSLISTGQLVQSTEIETFEADTLYKVAVNDYVFDKTSNPFINGTDTVITSLILRTLVEDELLLQKEVYASFSVNNALLSEPTID